MIANMPRLAGLAVLLALTSSACASDGPAETVDEAVDFTEAMAAAQDEIADLTESCMASTGFGGRPAIDTLTPSESEAYQSALLGDPSEPTIDTLTAEEADALAAELETGRFNPRFGCAPQSEFLVQSRIVGAGTLDEAVTLEELVGSDPTIVMLQDEWASCMRRVGFDVTTQDDIEQQIAAEIQRTAPGDTEPQIGNDEVAPPPPAGGDAGGNALSEFESEIYAANDSCWAPVAERVDARLAELLADQ